MPRRGSIYRRSHFLHPHRSRAASPRIPFLRGLTTSLAQPPTNRRHVIYIYTYTKHPHRVSIRTAAGSTINFLEYRLLTKPPVHPSLTIKKHTYVTATCTSRPRAQFADPGKRGGDARMLSSPLAPDPYLYAASHDRRYDTPLLTGILQQNTSRCANLVIIFLVYPSCSHLFSPLPCHYICSFLTCFAIIWQKK